MNRKLEWELECKILGMILSEFNDQFFQVEIEPAITGTATYLHVREKKKGIGWVKVVWGNGSSFISDYTTNLEPYIERANKFAEQFD